MSNHTCIDNPNEPCFACGVTFEEPTIESLQARIENEEELRLKSDARTSRIISEQQARIAELESELIKASVVIGGYRQGRTQPPEE